ncbi:MAG: hypothetical protein LRZ84_14460 [Desertifilum sp.]|nr:hypothetical protein [Desertifilum sp.]
MGFTPGKHNEQIIINEAARQGITDPHQVAYILATARHESDQFNTLNEYSDGGYLEGRTDLGNVNPGDGPRYKGRGFVQLTGRTNYEKYSQITGQDLVGNPDLVNASPELSAQILVHGMKTGHFTGVGLDDYVGNGKTDFWNARRIVNGTDRAGEIAAYAEEYLAKINSGELKAGVPVGTSSGGGGGGKTVKQKVRLSELPEPEEDPYLDKCPHLLMRGIVTDYGRTSGAGETTLTISGESYGKLYKDSFVLTDLASPETQSQSLEVRQISQQPQGIVDIYYQILEKWVEEFWGVSTNWEARTRPIPVPPNYLTRINNEGSAWSNLEYLAVPGFFHIFSDHTGAIIWEKLPYSGKEDSVIPGRNWEDLQLLECPSWKIIEWSDRLSEQGLTNFIRAVPTMQGIGGGQEPASSAGVVYNQGAIQQYGGVRKREFFMPIGVDGNLFFGSELRTKQQSINATLIDGAVLEAIRWYDRPVQRCAISVRGESAWRIHTKILITEDWSNPDAIPGEYYVVSRSHMIAVDRGEWRTSLELVRDRRLRYLGIGIAAPRIIEEVVSEVVASAGTTVATFFEDKKKATEATETANYPAAETTSTLALPPDNYYWFNRQTAKIEPIGNDPIAHAKKTLKAANSSEQAAKPDKNPIQLIQDTVGEAGDALTEKIMVELQKDN